MDLKMSEIRTGEEQRKDVLYGKSCACQAIEMDSRPLKRNKTRTYLYTNNRRLSSKTCLFLTISVILVSHVFQELRELFIHPAGKGTQNFGGISFVAGSTSEWAEICDGLMSFEREIADSKFPRAKDSPTPVTFQFLRRTYRPNLPLKVIIYTEGVQLFNTFFIQAHDAALNTPVGTFNEMYSDNDVTIISCGGKPADLDTVVTESSQFRSRTKITLYWNPPENFNKTVVFRINALTTDRPDNGWRGLTSEEILPRTKECYTGQGDGYRGSMAHTKSGLFCQRWDSQAPHSHTLYSQNEKFADKGLLSDFCRKPNTDDGPWCFTSSNDTRDELCDIPKCSLNGYPEHFIEFGEIVSDAKLHRAAGEIGRINFIRGFPMIKAEYKSVAVSEDGVLVLGKDSESLDGIGLLEDGSFTISSESSNNAQNTAVIAPFWTNIRRNSSSIGLGYVFFRDSIEPDVILPLGDVITENLKTKGEAMQKKFEPSWAFVATWHLVSDIASITDVQELNSFQAVLATDGNRSFVLYNYDMNKWTDDDHTALVGYNAGDGIRFLNHTLPYTKVSALEIASSLARAITDQSNVGRPGQMMYEVSMCDQETAVLRSRRCRDSLTLRLKAPKPSTDNSAGGRQPYSRSDENINACDGSDCGKHGECDVNTDVCVCEPGYAGTECESDIDECASSPCQNGGNCTDDINEYRCLCRPGYTGTLCQDDINDCFNSPCQNEGTCIDRVNSYKCVCSSGYKGANCEKLVDQCASQPCKNEGNCTNVEDSYTCTCPRGNSGEQCQYFNCFDGAKCKTSQRCFDQETQKHNCTCRQDAIFNENCQQITPTSMPACPPSTSGNIAAGYITWPTTADGGIAISSCPTPTSSVATRKCESGKWEEPDVLTCGELSSTSRTIDRLASSIIVAENASDVASQLLSATSNGSESLVAYDIANTAQLLDKIVNVSGHELDYAISNDVFACVSNVMEASSEEIRSASLEFSSNSRLVKVVDNVMLKVNVTSGQEIYIESKNIKAGISKFNTNETFTGTSFSISSNLQPIISNSEDMSSAPAAISLPPSIMNSVSPGRFTRLQFAVYTSTSLFDHARTDSVAIKTSKESSNYTVYSDYVVSASVGNTKLSRLHDNVTITISKSNSFYGEGPYCVFYQFPADGGEGSWSSDGCYLREATAERVICECNHLTNFAAIMDVYGTVEYLDKYQQMILSILTYIGCGLSIFGLLCTLISYTIFEKIRKEVPAKILICLCIALIAVNVVYVCLQSAYYSTPTACVAVAAIMHYTLLSSLMWMGLEAVNMYIALVKVFNTYYRKYMLKLSLVGWGVPLLIVLIAFIIQFATGVPSYEMNSKTEICWLRREVFYGTLVAPFGLVLLLNTVIYCLVLAQLLGMSSRKLKHLDSARKMRRPAKKENVRKLRGAVGLMALLGISWGLALGTIDKAALAFSYVFVLFNSSQGFWVFIFHCVLKKEVIKAWKKLIFNKGKDFREGSSRWSRFSSSNTRSSRSTSMTSTARSMSAASIKTSYLVPKTSRSVSKSEASIGMDSKGLDVVTRTISNGYSNPVFDEPDIGDPPPFPPPPIPVTEERVVRKVLRKTNAGPSNTIATQTNVNFLESRDTDSQHSAESDLNSRQSQASHDHDNEDEERRDSVDENFGSRGFRHPFHREVVMSPSNESGIYSDASISSTAHLVDVSPIVGLDHEEIMTSHSTDSYVRARNDVTKDASRYNTIANATPGCSNTTTGDSGQRYAVVEPWQAKFKDDSQATDSGISVTSDANTYDSPLTSRSQDSRPELQTQDSRSSLYSTTSNTSSVSAPSSASETTTNPPSPHMWKAPLVIKRSEDHGIAAHIGEVGFQRKPILTSQQGITKRTLWKKHRKNAHSVDETALSGRDSNLSPSRRKFRRKLPKSQSLDEESASKNVDDVKMTDFSINRGSFHDGAL